MTNPIIGPDSQVTMHFSIKLEDNSVADSTKVNGKPGTVKLGDGTLSANFEKELYGLKAGDKKAFKLQPEDGFGLPHPDNIHQLPREQFKDLHLEKGIIIEFSMPNGNKIPGVIRDFNETSVTVDFNNPLAGQILNIEVEILEVKYK